MFFSELPFLYSMLLLLHIVKGDKKNCPHKLFYGKLTGANLSNFLPHKPYYLYHRICLTINKIVYFQHLLVSFEELLSLRLSDHFALVVGCINNN